MFLPIVVVSSTEIRHDFLYSGLTKQQQQKNNLYINAPFNGVQSNGPAQVFHALK